MLNILEDFFQNKFSQEPVFLYTRYPDNQFTVPPKLDTYVLQPTWYDISVNIETNYSWTALVLVA